MTPAGEDHTLILEAIRQRRSFALKQLLPEPINPEAIRLMLEAANWAPTHRYTEPWRFTVFTGAGREELSEAFGTAYRLLTPENRYSLAAEQSQRDRVWQAPVWISLGMCPVVDEAGVWKTPEWEELIAVGCAVQNAHLAASSLGLGAKWTSGAVAVHEHVARLVGLEPPARLLGFLYVGKPAIEWPQGTRRPIEDKVRWVTGGQSGE